MAFRRVALRLLLVGLMAAVPASLAVGQEAASSQAASQPGLKSVLLAELHSTHDKAEWFVPVDIVVAGLTAEQARWIPPANGANNPAPADHSAGMIAYHLLFWNTNALAKFNGQKPPPVPADNSETFNDFDAAKWAETVHKLDAVLTAWEQAVAAASDAKVAANAGTIAHVATHNAYHTGQIVLLRKLQGSWDPANGVK